MIFKNLKKFLVPSDLIGLIQFHVRPFPYKRYSLKHECIFIHIPKTAGTSILNVLSKRTEGRDHNDYLIYLRANPVIFHKYFKFTFVRNPYDRIVSSYEYLHNGGNYKRDRYYYELFRLKYDTFEKFALDYLDSNKIHEELLFKPQYLFIYDHTGECRVDYVGRYENIENDFNAILNKLNIHRKLQHINSSKRKNYKQYYVNDEVKKKIQYLYKNDFELFNYEL